MSEAEGVKVKKQKKGLFDLFSRIKHTTSEEKKEKKEKKEKSKKEKKEAKEKKLTNEENSKLPPVAIANPKVAGYATGSMVNLLKNMPDWRDQTRKVVVEGNFETFPIAGDLPRLLKHLSIVRKTNENEISCLFPEDGNKTDGKVKIVVDVQGNKVTTGDCLKVIQCITKIFDEKHCERVEKEWNAVMDNSEDLSVQKTFLMRVLKSVYVDEGSNEVSPVITFLKAINQKIIASSTMKLKAVCGNLFIKDAQPMVWEIAVILDGDKTIISHYRRQETTSKNSEEYFRFLWELRLVFNKEMTQLQELKMGINDIEFNPNTISSVREKVESTLESLKFEDCVVSDLEDSSSEEE
ncbi:hypothetical protein EDI_076310 [Entamoeba dispar SAW760]|uniref:Ras guanine nucleotide exchange factor glfB-like C-terminal domain-containing protein n=1 Tax=Entamoeba dispar (strain ATCC PRA-260 / SAW760) TaxID=370354 RepID=B0EH00_ENTDS|nr:uncharacterized protein EDI_076310 [Entamoeba dispar SAW760]EDR26215.1 hypothetical protein EDI_076310 [Entamoeba dispar SAW760]|eukprot:EDR26215.1 hypothetical protein EDI_076310 [Entamoeba dispar SAW760]